MAEKIFRAGAATSNITPKLGTELNGYMQPRAAEHIHDELHARGLVLDDGHEQIAFVVCDNCLIPRAVIDTAKEMVQGHTNFPLDRILVSATHAHSCPAAVSVFQSEADLEYCEFLAVRIADCIRNALDNLMPAKIGWGVGRAPQLVFNRRWKMKPGSIPPNPFGGQDQVKMNPPRADTNLVEPAGPTDPEISILAVKGVDGRPLAVLANYSLHYVGDTANRHVSADYYGNFAHRLVRMLKGDTLDPPAVMIMSNGTSGNINNINFREPAAKSEYYTRIRYAGQITADEVYRVYQTIPFHDYVTLDMREAVMTFRRRLPSDDDVAKAKYILSQGEGTPLKGLEDIYARETVLMSEWPREIETIVQAMRIGDLGIVSSPCETFVETGLAIKKGSPLQPTFTIELANDYAGYLPTPEAFQVGGYETWRARSSFLETEAEPKIRAKLLEMLGEVAKSR